MSEEKFVRFYEIGKLFTWMDDEAKIFAGIAANMEKDEIQKITGLNSNKSYEAIKSLVYAKLNTENHNEIREIAEDLSKTPTERLALVVAGIEDTLTPEQLLEREDIINQTIKAVKNNPELLKDYPELLNAIAILQENNLEY